MSRKLLEKYPKIPNVTDLPSLDELKLRSQPPDVINRPNAEHWMGRLYLRKISPYVTRLALRLGFSANSVTGLMIFVGLLGVWCFSLQGPLAFLGILGVQLYLLLDCVDGEVARFNKTQSANGIYLDRWRHYVVEVSIFVALGIRAWNQEQLKYVVLGLITALLASVAKVETDLVDSARLHSNLGKMPDSATAMNPKALASARNIFRYFPFHRLAHAAEASIAASIAITFDLIYSNLVGTKIIVMTFLIVLSLIMPLHLVSVLASSRLTAEGGAP